MATQIQLRRGTASAWTTANPILAVGEMGLETDTGRFKVGNGSSTWTALVYSSGLTGPTGPQGSTGAQGVLGAQGPTGAQGAVGTQGAQGSQGILGTQGVQGAVGATGSQGNQGSQGFQGPQGVQGFQGVVGSQGSQGFQGNQGFQGSQGAQGTQGPQGVQGFQGNQGVQGSQGSQGVQGSQGFQGTQGFQGSQGNQGSQGAQGFQGVTGAQGNQGSTGTQGSQGSQGTQGFQGSTTVGTAIDVTAASTTSTPLIVRSVTSQTANLSSWINASGNTVAFLNPGNGAGIFTIRDASTTQEMSMYADGAGALMRFGVPATPDAYAKMGAYNSAFTIEAFNRPTRYVRSGSDGVVMQVRGYSTQTNNLQEWQNSSGTVLAYVNSTGGARFVPRVTTITSSATPTINTDNCDAVTITALAAAITSMTTNLTGTPNNFDRLTIRIKDDGTARAITWGAKFVASGVALPTTTVISKVLTVGFIYDTVKAAWGCVAAVSEL